MSKKLEELKQLKKEFQEKAKQVFNEEFGELCKKVEGLSKVRWEQYTPYFNDGDTCEFRVYSPEFKFRDSKEYKSSYSIKNDLINDIENLLESDEMLDVLKDMFGDHTQVIYSVKDAEFEVEEYEHD